jgi:hypothetical protein
MMAFVQQFMDMGSKTFYELQQRYLKKIISIRPQNCNVLHIVGDNYDIKDSSLKFEERQRRLKSPNTRTYLCSSPSSASSKVEGLHCQT